MVNKISLICILIYCLKNQQLRLLDGLYIFLVEYLRNSNLMSPTSLHSFHLNFEKFASEASEQIIEGGPLIDEHHQLTDHV